jgi:hypothetical protein
MEIAFRGFATTAQSAPANSRKHANISRLAALVAVASLTALVPTRILAQATGEFLPLPAQARPLLELDFDTYVGGHVYRTGTRRDVEQSRAYLVDLLNWTKEEMSAVPFKPAAEPANVWAAQTVWLDQVATRVTARLVAKWKDTLAGADTFTHDTVSAAIVSLSTDAPKIPPESLK